MIKKTIQEIRVFILIDLMHFKLTHLNFFMKLEKSELFFPVL